MADPYQPTEHTAYGSLTAEEEISLYLRQTRPWVGLLSAILALSSLAMVGMGLVFTVSMMGVSSALGSDAGPFGSLMPLFGLLYVAFGLIYAIPTFLLGRFTVAASPDSLRNAAVAIRYQRDFWRFIGGMTLFFIVLYCGGILTMAALMPRM